MFDAIKKRLFHDPGFSTSSKAAEEAKATASMLLSLCNHEPPEVFSSFACTLVASLRSCVSSAPGSAIKKQKEAMWSSYHPLRCTRNFCDVWEQFVVTAVGRKPSPIFFQHTIHEVFKQLIKEQFEMGESADKHVREPTREEENALRYTAGYVCWKIEQKIMSSALPFKGDFIDCYEEGNDGTEDWLNASDRGGLVHVDDNTYLLFHEIEMVVRRHFNRATAHSLDCSSKESLLNTIVQEEDVQFQWCMMTTTIHDARMLCEHYVTICGYSFTGSCVELYKKSSKRALQKDKGLRKELFSSRVQHFNKHIKLYTMS